MFGQLGSMAKLLKNAGAMQEKLKASLREKIVEGSAGGGMVVVKANGLREILAVKIEKDVIDPAEADMLEDLVRAAVSQALAKADELAKGEVAGLAGGLGIPGLGNIADLIK